MKIGKFLRGLVGMGESAEEAADRRDLAGAMKHLRPGLPDDKALQVAAREFYLLFKTDGKRGVINREAISKAATRARKSLMRNEDALWGALTYEEQLNVRHLAQDDGLDINQVAAEHLIYDVMLLMLEIRFQLQPVTGFKADSQHAFLAITNSSSILAGSPPIRENIRRIQYVRIPSREKTWDGPYNFEAFLAADLEPGLPAIAPADGFYSTSVVRRIYDVPPGIVEANLFDVARRIGDATMDIKLDSDAIERIRGAVMGEGDAQGEGVREETRIGRVDDEQE